jgi:hypothetical protein
MTTHGTRLTTAGRRPDVALRPFRTPVRGHAFAARPPGVQAPHPGQVARLEREPDNPADRLAVAVWAEHDGAWWRVGYLDRGVAARIAPRLDRGLRVDARVDGWVAEPRGRWRRPVVLLLPDGVRPFATGPAPGRRAPRAGGARRRGRAPHTALGPPTRRHRPSRPSRPHGRAAAPPP